MPETGTSIFPEAERVVAIGDIEGHLDRLVLILRAAGLIDARRRWRGGRAHLVQLGDIYGRGEHPKACCDLLRRLADEAERAGGAVHVLVGNHEAEVLHQFDFECDAAEYMEVADEEAMKRWHFEREAAAEQFWFLPPEESLPMANLLAAWELLHPPGREEFHRELSPEGDTGRWLRTRPAAVMIGPAVFVHAGITPAWAAMGLDEINRLVREALADDTYYPALSEDSPIVDGDGPLWTRDYAWGGGKAGGKLREALMMLGARTMVVGHTPGGAIRARHSRRVVCIDTAIGRENGGRPSALLIEDEVMCALYPPDTRKMLGRIPRAVKAAVKAVTPGIAAP